MPKFFLKMAALACLLIPSAAVSQFSDPQCREIRLEGNVIWPDGTRGKRPAELSAFYQMNFQDHPALLFANVPLQHDRFKITLSSLQKFPPPPLPRDWKPPPDYVAETRSSESAPSETHPKAEVQEFHYYAPVMFLYPREIGFQVFAKTPDGRFRSALQTIQFFHEKKAIAEVAGCQSRIEVPPLEMR